MEDFILGGNIVYGRPLNANKSVLMDNDYRTLLPTPKLPSTQCSRPLLKKLVICEWISSVERKETHPLQ